MRCELSSIIMDFPADLRYSSDHEWVRVDANIATIGITDFAQDALGDIVYVSPAEVGERVATGATISEVESTKSVSEIYAPLSGIVVERNEALDAQPELLNRQPYGDGWIVKIEVGDPGELAVLLDVAAYQAMVQ